MSCLEPAPATPRKLSEFRAACLDYPGDALLMHALDQSACGARLRTLSRAEFLRGFARISDRRSSGRGRRTRVSRLQRVCVDIPANCGPSLAGQIPRAD